ncbi:hypothetical protein ACHAXS_011668 [Conticribra weissflogii]
MNHSGSSPVAEDDSTPFLISRVIQRDGWQRGDVSTITSPCFEAEKQSRSKSPIGSLFARLSRGLRVDNSKPGHGKVSIEPPATPFTSNSPNGIDSISTIKAEGSISVVKGEVKCVESKEEVRNTRADSADFTNVSQRDHNHDRDASPGFHNEPMPNLLRELAGLSVSDSTVSNDATRDSIRSESSRRVTGLREPHGMASSNSLENRSDELEVKTARSAATTYSIHTRSNSTPPKESTLQRCSSRSPQKNTLYSRTDAPSIHYREEHRSEKRASSSSTYSCEKEWDPWFIAGHLIRKKECELNSSHESSIYHANPSLQQGIHHVNFDSKINRQMNFQPEQRPNPSSKTIASRKKNVDSMKTTNSLSSEKSTTASKSFDKSADTQSTREENEWREVTDPESGCKYYYNRKTRISKWRLPKGAILAKPRKSSSKRTSTSKYQTNSSKESAMQQHQSSYLTALKTETQSRSSELHNTNISVLSEESSHSRKEPSINVIYQPLTSKPTPRNATTNKTVATANVREIAQSQQERDSESRKTEGQNSMLFHLKSPQDCKSGDTNVYCLYCGLKCQSAAILRSHLAQCIHFSRMQGREQLSAHIEIEKALFNAWSRIDCTYKATAINGTKSELNPPGRNDLRSSVLPSKQFCNLSFESADVISSESSTREQCFETGRDEYISYSRTSNESQHKIQILANDFNIETKSCPFCSKLFTQGSHLSGHLLNCKERRRLRRQRRSKRTENYSLVENRKKNTTPGRKMPWE